MATQVAMQVGRAAGRAVWEGMKRVGKVAMPDNPKDAAEAAEKVLDLFKIWTRERRGNPPLPPVIDGDLGPFAAIPVIDESRFLESKKVKLFKAMMAAGAVYGVYRLDVAARHRLAQKSEIGAGLILAISGPAATPLPTPLTKSANIVPRDVVSAAILLVGPVCPGLIGYPSNVNYELPPPIPGPISSYARFDPAGFILVVLLPFLSSLFQE